MGKNSFITALIGLLLVCGFFTAFYSIYYWKNARELRNLQGRALYLSQNQNVLRGLMNETIEYSKRNPAIDPLLVSIGLKAKNAPASPRSKP